MAAPCAAGAATAAAVPPMLDANKVAALPPYLRGAILKETSGRRQMRIRGRRAAIRDGTAPVLFSRLILVYGVDLPAKRAQDRCQQCIGCSRSSAYRRDRRELRNSTGAAGGGHQRRRRASCTPSCANSFRLSMALALPRPSPGIQFASAWLVLCMQPTAFIPRLHP